MEVNGSTLEGLLIRLSLAIEDLSEGDIEPSTIPYTLLQLLDIAVEHRASLLHLNVGSPPMLRINDRLVPIGEDAINRSDCRRLLSSILSREQKQFLYSGNEIEMCFPAAGTGFRVNVYMERGSMSAAIRRLRSDIPKIENLGFLGTAVHEALSETSGLIVLTGTPKCGKINTLAALLSHINSSRSARIISLEQPIQFWHHNKMSTIIQREVGIDTESFARGVQQAVLQDPDILALTDLPDRETAEFVIRAAAGGHLVIAVLDASSSVRALERLLSTFPSQNDARVISTLASSLRTVICQTLVRRADGRGFIPAFEVLVNTEEVSRKIRNDQLEELHWIMRNTGMQTLGTSLAKMIDANLVTREEAEQYIEDDDEIEMQGGGEWGDMTAGSGSDNEGGDDDTPLMAWL